MDSREHFINGQAEDALGEVVKLLKSRAEILDQRSDRLCDLVTARQADMSDDPYDVRLLGLDQRVRQALDTMQHRVELLEGALSLIEDEFCLVRDVKNKNRRKRNRKKVPA